MLLTWKKAVWSLLPLCLGAAFKLRHLPLVLDQATRQLYLRLATCFITTNLLHNCCLLADPVYRHWTLSWPCLDFLTLTLDLTHHQRLGNWLPSLDLLCFSCLGTVGLHSLLVRSLPLPALLAPLALVLSSFTQQLVLLLDTKISCEPSKSSNHYLDLMSM